MWYVRDVLYAVLYVGGVVTVDSSCCANYVEPPAPSNEGPIYRVLGMPAMRSRWMDGSAAHKSG